MFHATGGWVLKPEGYRSFHKAQSQISALDRGRLDLSIEVLAGQDIGPVNKRFHLYVRSELHIEDMEEIMGGEPAEGGQTKEGQVKAAIELGTPGRSPDFGRQVLQFRGVPGVSEELTFVRYVYRLFLYCGDTSHPSTACTRLASVFIPFHRQLMT
jgi:hypothetical protein